jgi:protein involved in polysaccharide export with SLBB domain
MEVCLPRLSHTDVWEIVLECDVVSVDVVAQDSNQVRVEGEVRVSTIQSLIGSAGDSQQRDINDVIRQATAVGETTGITGKQT